MLLLTKLDMFVKNSKLSVPKESGAMNEASLIFGELVSNITQHLENLLG
jgi:hypothetical protein